AYELKPSIEISLMYMTTALKKFSKLVLPVISNDQMPNAACLVAHERQRHSLALQPASAQPELREACIPA
ncbi:MAG: hypothetical protein AAF557_09140, partial [Pseudomonadota bacterium]